MRAHEFYIFLFIKCCEVCTGGGGCSGRAQKLWSFTGKYLFFCYSVQKLPKMMSYFFKGCPEGGRNGSAFSSQKLGGAGFWSMPAAFGIPFPIMVSLPQEPCQLTSLHRLQVVPPAFKSSVHVCVCVWRQTVAYCCYWEQAVIHHIYIQGVYSKLESPSRMFYKLSEIPFDQLISYTLFLLQPLLHHSVPKKHEKCVNDNEVQSKSCTINTTFRKPTE